MKASNFFDSITISLLTMMVLFSTTLTAQNYWKGGTKGAETTWNHPHNWSLNHVPNWSDKVVIIPDVSSQSGYFPVVYRKVPDIPCLNIEGGAEVTIATTGVLIIDGETTYNYGILNTGGLTNAGKLLVTDTAMEPFSAPTDNIQNIGIVAFNYKDFQGSDGIALNK
jgi:hypothetical protein